MTAQTPDASPLDPFFLFALGQEVTLKAMLTPFLAGSATAHACRDDVPPQKMVVIERHLSECSGGHQQHYDCRRFTISFVYGAMTAEINVIRVNESELAPYPGTGGNVV